MSTATTPTTAVTLAQQLHGLRMIEHPGACLACGDGVLDIQPLGEGDLAVIIHEAAVESLGREARLQAQALPLLERCRWIGQALIIGEGIVEDHACAQLQAIGQRRTIHRHDEGQRLDQVRRILEQPLALPQILAHQIKVILLQVPQARHAPDG